MFGDEASANAKSVVNGDCRWWCGCARLGRREEETYEDHKDAFGLNTADHRRTVASIIREQARLRKSISSSVPGSRNWRRA